MLHSRVATPVAGSIFGADPCPPDLLLDSRIDSLFCP